MSTLQQLAEEAKLNYHEHSPMTSENSVHHLFDYRVVSYIAGRQKGGTSAILNIFNPDTDVYVTTDRLLIDEFGRRLGKPFRYLNLNSKNIRDVFHHITTAPVERVFYDIGAAGLFRRRNVIDFTIKALDATLGESENPIYVLT